MLFAAFVLLCLFSIAAVYMVNKVEYILRYRGLRPGRRPVASWNLAYQTAASQIPLHYPGRRPGATWSQTC